MHLAIAGNIGSGKTTLTTLLAKHYRYTPHFEQVDDNPYLNDFYKDMTRWSFNLQIYFLKSRFAQLIEMKKKGKPIIQDRTIYEDAHIFAPNLQAMGLMTTRDFENYLSLFELMEEFVTWTTTTSTRAKKTSGASSPPLMASSTACSTELNFRPTKKPAMQRAFFML